MAIVSKSLVDQQAIRDAVQRAADDLSPTVVRIRYDFGSDWTGDPAIFFRIVLADEAAQEPKVIEIVQRVARILSREVKVEEMGLNAFFNFRSLAEQSKLNDSDWT